MSSQGTRPGLGDNYVAGIPWHRRRRALRSPQLPAGRSVSYRRRSFFVPPCGAVCVVESLQQQQLCS